jgi:hypothetical protein
MTTLTMDAFICAAKVLVHCLQNYLATTLMLLLFNSKDAMQIGSNFQTVKRVSLHGINRVYHRKDRLVYREINFLGPAGARDGNKLRIVRAGENLTFGEWADLFLENYSKRHVREQKTYAANLRAANHLKRGLPLANCVRWNLDSLAKAGLVRVGVTKEPAAKQ